MLQNTNKSILENVNEKSDATLTKNFFEEYNKIIKNTLNSHMPLNLFDALERMHFINADILREVDHQDVNDRYRKLKVLLKDQNCNLLIVSNQADNQHDDL